MTCNTLYKLYTGCMIRSGMVVWKLGTWPKDVRNQFLFIKNAKSTVAVMLSLFSILNYGIPKTD